MKDIFETYGSAILALCSMSVVFGMAAYVFLNGDGGFVGDMVIRGIGYLS